MNQEQIDRMAEALRRQGLTWSQTSFAVSLVRNAVEAERDRWRLELAYAEAALSDIGDAEREPGDDLAWCEARAAAALLRVRHALGVLK